MSIAPEIDSDGDAVKVRTGYESPGRMQSNDKEVFRLAQIAGRYLGTMSMFSPVNPTPTPVAA
jgi:hypothetical protein